MMCVYLCAHSGTRGERDGNGQGAQPLQYQPPRRSRLPTLCTSTALPSAPALHSRRSAVSAQET